MATRGHKDHKKMRAEDLTILRARQTRRTREGGDPFQQLNLLTIYGHKGTKSTKDLTLLCALCDLLWPFITGVYFVSPEPDNLARACCKASTAAGLEVAARSWS